MYALIELADNFKRLDNDKVFTQVFKNDGLLRFIVSQNTWKQLYDLGVDSKGVPLGSYAPRTIELKLDPEVGHITLKETGRFYDSFRAMVRKGEIEITADPISEGDDITASFGGLDEILGLTDESMDELITMILNEGNIQEIIREALLQGI